MTDARTAKRRTLTMTLAAGILAACGGGGGSTIGPDQSSLVGEWAMSGTMAPIGPGVELSDIEVDYAADGSSDYRARMSVPGEGNTTVVLRLDGDVRWELEETILTRTLESMEVSAETDTPAAREIAAAYEAGLNQSPPARFIVERLDETSLVLLDPETGQTLSFARQ